MAEIEMFSDWFVVNSGRTAEASTRTKICIHFGDFWDNFPSFVKKFELNKKAFIFYCSLSCFYNTKLAIVLPIIITIDKTIRVSN